MVVSLLQLNRKVCWLSMIKSLTWSECPKNLLIILLEPNSQQKIIASADPLNNNLSSKFRASEYTFSSCEFSNSWIKAPLSKSHSKILLSPPHEYNFFRFLVVTTEPTHSECSLSNFLINFPLSAFHLLIPPSLPQENKMASWPPKNRF